MARITIVNDYPDFLELMTSILDDISGHEVTGLDSSEVTADDLIGTSPDLLIVDLGTARDMLGIGRADGSTGPLARVPTIVCSGDIPGLRDEADAVLGTGTMYSLEKPFTLDILASTVHRALRNAANLPTA